ncbi:MAG: RNA methyltransferase [Vulcanimicrobiaceae bacterium]
MIGTPLGRHAPALELVRALLTKSGRRDAGQFAIEGPTMLAEALDAGCLPLALYATDRGLDALAGLTVDGAPHQLLEAIPQDRIFVVDDRTMAKLSDLDTPPGILAVLTTALAPLGALLTTGAPALVLAGVSDPGNAGTLLRSAEIFGIDHAIFAREAVEPHNPKVVRATMGALFRMRIAVASATELAAAAREHGYTIVAATRDGTSLPDFVFPNRSLVAIGNERHGVSRWLPQYDSGVTIPQHGRGESLNASVAGGIILYAFSQQCERTIFEA